MKFICRICKAEFSNPKDMSDHAYNEHVKLKQGVVIESNPDTLTKEWQQFQAMTDRDRADFCSFLWGWTGMEKASKAFADWTEYQEELRERRIQGQ